MAKKIVWSNQAKVDLQNILYYWVQRNKSNVYSLKLKLLIENTVNWIAANPNVRRTTDYAGIYIKIIRDYEIIFEEADNSINILTIWDTRQDPKKLSRLIEKKKNK